MWPCPGITSCLSRKHRQLPPETGVLIAGSFSLCWLVTLLRFAPAWALVVWWPKFDWTSLIFFCITKSDMRLAQFQLCKNGLPSTHLLSETMLAFWEHNQSEQSQRTPTLRPPAVTILKCIIILSLNLCFISDIQWDNGACLWEERICRRKKTALHFSTFKRLSLCFVKKRPCVFILNWALQST